MRESTYQARLIKKLRDRFPGCVILKNDTDYIQGIPDLLILWGGRWGSLEVKISEHASQEPNQDYWVDYLNDMWFAAFIYPENEAEILDALQQALESSGDTRVP
jgi:hypothetical protein